MLNVPSLLHFVVCLNLGKHYGEGRFFPLPYLEASLGAMVADAKGGIAGCLDMSADQLIAAVGMLR